MSVTRWAMNWSIRWGWRIFVEEFFKKISGVERWKVLWIELEPRHLCTNFGFPCIPVPTTNHKRLFTATAFVAYFPKQPRFVLRHFLFRWIYRLLRRGIEPRSITSLNLKCACCIWLAPTRDFCAEKLCKLSPMTAKWSNKEGGMMCNFGAPRVLEMGGLESRSPHLPHPSSLSTSILSASSVANYSCCKSLALVVTWLITINIS